MCYRVKTPVLRLREAQALKLLLITPQQHEQQKIWKQCSDEVCGDCLQTLSARCLLLHKKLLEKLSFVDFKAVKSNNSHG